MWAKLCCHPIVRPAAWPLWKESSDRSTCPVPAGDEVMKRSGASSTTQSSSSCGPSWHGGNMKHMNPWDINDSVELRAPRCYSEIGAKCPWVLRTQHYMHSYKYPVVLGCLSLSSHENNKRWASCNPIPRYCPTVVAPRDEMKSEQGDDNDATCGPVGVLRIHSAHISTPTPIFTIPL